MSTGSGRARLSASHARSSTSGYGAANGGARKRAAGGDLGAAGGANSMGSRYGIRNWKPEVEMNGSAIDGRESQQQNDPPRLLTLPTVLTIGRVVAVPILVSTFYMDGLVGTTVTTSIFLLAAVTDWLDGYIARKLRQGTAFGAFLDPVADKLMVAATLVLLCTKPLECAVFREFHWLLTAPSIAIIGREITMSAVREWAASQNSRVVEVFLSFSVMLLLRSDCLYGRLKQQSVFVAFGVALLYASAGLAVWSLIVYVRKIWRVLLK